MKIITRGEALRRFMRATGMTYAKVNRLGIKMIPCTCGLPVCNGWLAVNAWQDADGRPRRWRMSGPSKKANL